MELLWTHRYPYPEGNACSAPTSSDGSSTPSAAVTTMAAFGAQPQPACRAPRSGGVEAGGVGATGAVGVGHGATSTVDSSLRDRTVTALCFHQHNGDVLAAGYGNFCFSSPSAQNAGGAVLFWTVRLSFVSQTFSNKVR